MISPLLIPGHTFVDDRGVMVFNNNMDLSCIKRSYFMSGDKGMIRAWHGHKLESKIIQCVSGRVRICAVDMDGTIEDNISTFYLTNNGSAVVIPKNHYNGIQFLSDNSSIIVYSSTTLQESKDDDYRLAWDIYGVEIWSMENYR